LLSQKNNLPHLSVAIPVYQAEGLIEELVRRLEKNLPPITQSYEIILVDDGSPDKSWKKVKDICANKSHIHGIRLSRNYGQHSAISAAIEASKGEWIVVMDCDLQDRPEEIQNLYHKAQEGYDIVLASREVRQDSKLKCFFSKLFYKILSFLSGTKYDSSVANFGIYHRSVINSLLKMQETIRYFPAMINWVGFSKITLSVVHSERLLGKSSYNFKKQVKLALNIILAYSDKPLRIIVVMGLLFSFLAFILGCIIVYFYFSGKVNVIGYASLITSICFFSGIIVSVLGVIGLYVGKIFDGIKNRPIYLVKEELNE
jgi:glycosyltransferase involved in cell wall biosynthesis